MPLKFSVHPDEGYFVSHFSLKQHIDEMLDGYKNFFESVNWIPGLNELVDLSDSDFSAVTSSDLKLLVNYIRKVYEKHKLIEVKVAVFAPKALPFGIARVYEALAYDSPENVMVFRTFDEAESWLKDQKKT